MTINQLFCPCLSALAVAALLLLTWSLCVVAARSDARMEKPEE